MAYIFADGKSQMSTIISMKSEKNWYALGKEEPVSVKALS